MKSLVLCAMLLCAPVLALAQDVCAPEATTNLSVSAIGRFSVVVSFSAPHQDCSSGGAVSEYAVRIFSSSPTEQTFWGGTAFTDVPAVPGTPGFTECADALSLSQGTTYYVAMKSKDSAGNWSPVSNVVSFTTHTTGTSPVCS